MFNWNLSIRSWHTVEAESHEYKYVFGVRRNVNPVWDDLTLFLIIYCWNDLKTGMSLCFRDAVNIELFKFKFWVDCLRIYSWTLTTEIYFCALEGEWDRPLLMKNVHGMDEPSPRDCICFNEYLEFAIFETIVYGYISDVRNQSSEVDVLERHFLFTCC